MIGQSLKLGKVTTDQVAKTFSVISTPESNFTQVVHITLTHFILILTYFHFLPLYELECKILVKIPGSMLDSAIAVQGKEGDIVKENI